MKTTLDIRDWLMLRAIRISKRTVQLLRALMKKGLRRRFEGKKLSSFTLEDCSVGDARKPNPLEAFSWEDLRAEIYGNEAER